MEGLVPTGLNGSEIIQSAGVITSFLFSTASLFISATALFLEAKERRISNRLKITENHRDFWSTLFTRPDLGRILKRDLDLAQEPVTDDEELFVTLAVLHLGSVLEAIRAGMYPDRPGIGADVLEFFSRPIPKVVWERIKRFQDAELIAFVEAQTAAADSRAQA